MRADRGPVLVVEPNMEGHRFNYVRILVRECHQRRLQVSVLTTESGREDYLRKSEDETPPAWQLIPDGTRPGPHGIESASRRAAAGIVVVPDGDRTALAFARRAVWRGSGNLRILIMRARAQGGRFAWLAPLKSVLRQAGFTVAGAIPRVTLLTLTSALSVQDVSSTQVADPIEFAPTDEARRTLRTALGDDDRFWFSVAGWLDARKNIPLVLAALTDAARDTGRPLGLLLAGRQDPGLTRELASAATGEVKLAMINRHLTAAELDAAVEAADCMVLAHSNEGPSGIMGKAAAARTHVIAAGARTLVEDCHRLGPAAQWVELDRVALAGAAAAAVARPAVGAVPVATPSDFGTALLGLT